MSKMLPMLPLLTTIVPIPLLVLFVESWVTMRVFVFKKNGFPNQDNRGLMFGSNKKVCTY